MENKEFKLNKFVLITLITSIWINIAEVARALFVAFPKMKAFFGNRMDIGPMEFSNMLIWGLWDMILTIVLVYIFWTTAKAFGNNNKSIFISGTMTTIATLGIFWIANVNTGLGTWGMAFTIIPIAWVEMIIGSWIASKLYNR